MLFKNFSTLLLFAYSIQLTAYDFAVTNNILLSLDIKIHDTNSPVIQILTTSLSRTLIAPPKTEIIIRPLDFHNFEELINASNLISDNFLNRLEYKAQIQQ